MNAGESYEVAARRELKEKIGVVADLGFVGNFFSDEDREYVGAFLGSYDGALQLEPMEVMQVDYFSPERLEREPPQMRATVMCRVPCH